MPRNGLARTMRALLLVAAAAALIVPASASARYAARTLGPGAQGSDVTLLQRYLTKAGFRTAPDGQYGAQTQRAERRFERSHGRPVDGRASRADQRLVRQVARQRSDASDAAPAQSEGGNSSDKARLSSDGRTAIAPDSAPQVVKDVIAAANRITDKPYRYGGGHGSWEDSGYDCSGSVSYALHGGDLIDRPEDSSGLMSYGQSGAGRWISVYANSGHAYAIIAGLRFDTSSSGTGGDGPRWREESRSSSGYTLRHPDGL
jgi:peptidoglycan hydrolase-like protein with peptidoglycan-binding domain